ncbi:hypothetical protein KSF_068010 [Reticulibacter mediterranei]|uniref:Glycoside hydrolase 123 catalytic domain-containing protein n=2 Tax=Reticulibacter mediterranei TaxID=2778369 RepID=A0A8J3IMJ1_9CHLR|nr:hypothetical protein KSF_068010 [Reticulibacter mediterranei]
MHLGLQSMFFKYVWSYPSWQQHAQATSTKQFDLTCCRRDTTALQAVVCSDDPFVLTVNNDPFFWKAGSVPIGRIEVALDEAIPVQVQLVGLIPDDHDDPTSDILLDQTHIYVEGKKLQQVWIECTTTEDVPPGIYHGSVRLYTHSLFEDEQLQEECRFTITVKEPVMPRPAEYRFFLNIWQHHSNIARKYQVALWSDEHFSILEQYMSSLAALGQKAATLIVSEIPWSGQRSFYDREPSDLFEYNMVGITKAPDGHFVYDFATIDRYVALAETYGMTQEIEVLGLINIWQAPEAGYGSIVAGDPDAIRLRYYDATTRAYKFIREGAELDAYIHALEAHFIEKGWIEHIRITADEPENFALFQQQWEHIQQVAPSLKLKVAINHAEFIERGVTGIYDAVPNFACATQQHQKLMASRSQLPGKLFYYVCCSPRYPNTLIASPSLECRLLPWLVERLQLDGFLRWAYTAWPDQPLTKISYRPTIWPAGDMCFVYPGARGKPLLSLRYKWLERGIKDYELMQIAKQADRTGWVEQLLDGVFLFQDASTIRSDTPAEKLFSYQLEDYERLLLEW